MISEIRGIVLIFDPIDETKNKVLGSFQTDTPHSIEKVDVIASKVKTYAYIHDIGKKYEKLKGNINEALKKMSVKTKLGWTSV